MSINIIIIITLFTNLILSHIVGNLGKEKKIGYNTSFLVSFFFSPLIGLLMVIASVQSENYKQDNKDDNKELINLTIFSFGMIGLSILILFLLN